MAAGEAFLSRVCSVTCHNLVQVKLHFRSGQRVRMLQKRLGTAHIVSSCDIVCSAVCLSLSLHAARVCKRSDFAGPLLHLIFSSVCLQGHFACLHACVLQQQY